VALAPAFGLRCPPLACPVPPLNAAYFNALRRVAVDTSGNIWGADLWGSGIHEFSPTGKTVLTDPGLVEIDGSPAPPPGFSEAYGVAVGRDGTAYGVDLNNQRVELFNAAGVYLNSVGFRGTAPGRFSWPEAAAVAPDGTLWVGDTRNNRLQHFSADLSSVLGLPVGSKGTAVRYFYHPKGIAVDGGGRVWVADTNNNRIETYNPTTQLFTAFGTRGTADGMLINPQGVAVSATDIYVADTGNNRIEKFTRSGIFEAKFSTGLNQPEGVTLAPDGSLWVADTMNNRIVHLSSALTDLGDGFGSAGTGSLQFDRPHSLAVHASVLFVADTFNNRIQEFHI
jgi:sugar lactone lactonase YvrE